MRVSSILYEKGINSFTDSEVIGKLVLCYYKNIYDNLIKLCSLKRRDDYYLDETINSETVENKLEIKHKYNINEKKYNIINTLFNKNAFKEFCYIENYIFPEGINDIQGPFIYDKNIIFYNKNNEILLVFTYTPLNYNIKNKKDYKSDIVVRDLNCYIIDNVSLENFQNYIESKVSATLDYIQILSFNSISIKVCDYFDSSKNKKVIELLRIVKEEIRNNSEINKLKHPFFKWEINEKGKFNDYAHRN